MLALKEKIESKIHHACWLDLEQMEAGDDLKVAMESGLRSVKAAIVALTAPYLLSVNCMFEYQTIKRLDKPVFLLLLDPYNKPRFARVGGPGEAVTAELGANARVFYHLPAGAFGRLVFTLPF